MVVLKGKVVFSVILLDAAQMLSLALIPTVIAIPSSPSVAAVFPPPSLELFLHIFLGNAFIGTLELIPFFSVFAMARGTYLLLPALTLVSATWHTTPLETIVRLMSFGYSWIELSSYSFATFQSFVFFSRMRERSLTMGYIVKTWGLVVLGLAVAATLEVMAMTIL